MQSDEGKHSTLNLLLIHHRGMLAPALLFVRSTPSRAPLEQWLDVSNVLTAYSCVGSAGFEEQFSVFSF